MSRIKNLKIQKIMIEKSKTKNRYHLSKINNKKESIEYRFHNPPYFHQSYFQTIKLLATN
jgi:hypothetical protein